MEPEVTRRENVRLEDKNEPFEAFQRLPSILPEEARPAAW